MSWGYIGPCLLFDFANLMYLIIRIILWFKAREAPIVEEPSIEVSTPPAFTLPTNDIGDAHIQTVTELPHLGTPGEGVAESVEK